MAGSMLGYWDYLKAAFHLKVPLGPLGALPLNKLLLWGLGILGFSNPGFWLVGLAYETGYLLWLPGSKRFQNVISGQKLLELQKQKEAQRRYFLNMLSFRSQRRYDALSSSGNRIFSSGSAEHADSLLDELKAAKLNDLLMVFARLLATREKIHNTLEATPQLSLEQDIATLETKISLEPDDSALKRSLQSSREIQLRRLENIRKAKQNLTVVDAELERIEKQTALLAEENQVGTDPAAFSARLDGVAASLQETNRWMSENSKLLTSLGVEGVKSGDTPVSE